jgi:hypothetical protein
MAMMVKSIVHQIARAQVLPHPWDKTGWLAGRTVQAGVAEWVVPEDDHRRGIWCAAMQGQGFSSALGQTTAGGTLPTH